MDSHGEASKSQTRARSKGSGVKEVRSGASRTDRPGQLKGDKRSRKARRWEEGRIQKGHRARKRGEMEAERG